MDCSSNDPRNPFFAKALVNRYWKHFFSRGIVDPEDDMRESAIFWRLLML